MSDKQTFAKDQPATRESKKPAQGGKVHKGELNDVTRLALVQPERLSPRDAIALQRLSGNRALQSVIQAKLTVGAADDPYEREADRVAAQVMAAPRAEAAPVNRQPVEEEEIQTRPIRRELLEEEEIQTQRVQRGPLDEEEIQAKPVDPLGSFEAGEGFDAALQSARGGGQPLPGEVRDFMEPRFGADFSGVRIHAGNEAANLNREISAQAFTYGQDIFIGAGRYNPGSDDGKNLLAHELTHVLQQTGEPRRLVAGQTTAGQGAYTLQRLPGVAFLTGTTRPGIKFEGLKLVKSTYALIIEALTAYHELPSYGAVDKRYYVLKRMRELVDLWKKNHPDESKMKKSEKARLGRLNILSRDIDEELVVAKEGYDRMIVEDKERQKNESEKRKLKEAEGNFEKLGDVDEADFLDEKTILSQKDVTKEGGGQLSKVFKIIHNFGILYKGNRAKKIVGGKYHGFWKENVGKDEKFGKHRGTPTGIPENDPHFRERSLATYKLDLLFGTNVIPPTYKSKLNQIEGYLQKEAEGEKLEHWRMYKQNQQGLELPPGAQKGLAKLYLLDIICGQVDRHEGNIFITDEGKITGIDNDLSFGKKYNLDKTEIGGLRLDNKDFMIYRPLAEKIIEVAKDATSVRNALQDLLSKEEIAATVTRILRLAEKLEKLMKSNPERVIGD